MATALKQVTSKLLTHAQSDPPCEFGKQDIMEVQHSFHTVKPKQTQKEYNYNASV